MATSVPEIMSEIAIHPYMLAVYDISTVLTIVALNMLIGPLVASIEQRLCLPLN
jgi:hypothetical protein